MRKVLAIVMTALMSHSGTAGAVTASHRRKPVAVKAGPPRVTGLPAPASEGALESLLMRQLLPGWSEATGDGTSLPDNKPIHARARAARLWSTENRSLAALLVDTGLGAGDSTDVAVFDLEGTSPRLVAEQKGVGHPGSVEVSFAPELVRTAPDESLLGLLIGKVVDRQQVRVLQLLSLEKDTLRVVFERPVLFTFMSAPQPQTCEADVSVDEFGTTPYPLKVTERCSEVRRTSTEMWRWEFDRYRLHGPASNATDPMDEFRADQ